MSIRHPTPECYEQAISKICNLEDNGGCSEVVPSLQKDPVCACPMEPRPSQSSEDHITVATPQNKQHIDPVAQDTDLHPKLAPNIRLNPFERIRSIRKSHHTRSTSVSSGIQHAPTQINDHATLHSPQQVPMQSLAVVQKQIPSRHAPGTRAVRSTRNMDALSSSNSPGANLYLQEAEDGEDHDGADSRTSNTRLSRNTNLPNEISRGHRRSRTTISISNKRPKVSPGAISDEISIEERTGMETQFQARTARLAGHGQRRDTSTLSTLSEFSNGISQSAAYSFPDIRSSLVFGAAPPGSIVGLDELGATFTLAGTDDGVDATDWAYRTAYGARTALRASFEAVRFSGRVESVNTPEQTHAASYSHRRSPSNLSFLPHTDEGIAGSPIMSEVAGGHKMHRRRSSSTQRLGRMFPFRARKRNSNGSEVNADTPLVYSTGHIEETLDRDYRFPAPESGVCQDDSRSVGVGLEGNEKKGHRRGKSLARLVSKLTGRNGER